MQVALGDWLDEVALRDDASDVFHVGGIYDQQRAALVLVQDRCTGFN